MTFEQIRQAIADRMASWPDAPLEMDGWQRTKPVQDAIDAGQAWVRVVIQHGDSLTASLGADPGVRRTGLVMCQVFTADNQGSRSAMLLADSLAAHLEHYRDNHFLTRAASAQRVGPDNGYYQINLAVPFVAY